jgi:hypothetical protein
MEFLIRGRSADRVCWAIDAVWTGSPQWQIEELRRLAIPEAMQNSTVSSRPAPPRVRSRARSVRRPQGGLRADGASRSNLRYGYVAGPMDSTVFA